MCYMGPEAEEGPKNETGLGCHSPQSKPLQSTASHQEM